jgi:putative hydrolase of the HAD superfamily
MQPHVVFFDLDNTLTHRLRSIEAYSGLFASHFATHLGVNAQSLIAQVIADQDNGGYLPPDSVQPNIRTAVAVSLHERLRWRTPVPVAELADHWFEHFPTQSVEMPGASHLIESLVARGMKVAIISNGARQSREATLAHLPFKHHVSALISSESAGCRKPDPAIFLHAAQALGMAPEQCLYVGDHPINDVSGAMAAGMSAVWLSGFHVWPEDEPPPAVCVEKLLDILPTMHMQD